MKEKTLSKELDFSFNPDLNTRKIVGDNYANPLEKITAIMMLKAQMLHMAHMSLDWLVL